MVLNREEYQSRSVALDYSRSWWRMRGSVGGAQSKRLGRGCFAAHASRRGNALTASGQPHFGSLVPATVTGRVCVDQSTTCFRRRDSYVEPSRHSANRVPANLRATATVAICLPRRCSMPAAQITTGSLGK